jgi:hypothetical protein
VPGRERFARGNDRLDRLLADQQLAGEVAAAHTDAEEMDRVYAMNLAMIRQTPSASSPLGIFIPRPSSPNP